jgi:hypothetical protein
MIFQNLLNFIIRKPDIIYIDTECEGGIKMTDRHGRPIPTLMSTPDFDKISDEMEKIKIKGYNTSFDIDSISKMYDPSEDRLPGDITIMELGPNGHKRINPNINESRM